MRRQVDNFAVIILRKITDFQLRPQQMSFLIVLIKGILQISKRFWWSVIRTQLNVTQVRLNCKLITLMKTSVFLICIASWKRPT